ncbi:MAG TPA: succinate dehydrogenase, hydrophobic membrane anchor protein [Geminicoccaceae bacterium]|jgi:succinate dehydrogenase / fumarate reductase, membrane anchor subunit|nr:succinate dehydrogenase, hydrophobic membrane anchor protein [Geminicoccaceae bacterium]
MGTRSPIARVRGLGAARSGVGHWGRQRLTAISNLLLVLWFIFSAIGLSGAGYAEVRAWLASPISASLMILLILSICYHARLGLQVVVEDYVHHEPARLATLVAIPLIVTALAVTCIVAVLKVSLGS